MPDIARARTLRKRPTWAEKLLWRWLRDRRFSAYKFRRQHPVGDYFLDFFCEEARLSIELDGFQHGHPARQVRDAERTKFLATLGIKELRFWNGRLRREPQVVRDTIFQALQERAPHPLPDYTRPGVVGESLRNTRPHPSPLPQGEGDPFDAL
jgi:very-short-patch-repair endonuclease